MGMRSNNAANVTEGMVSFLTQTKVGHIHLEIKFVTRNSQDMEDVCCRNVRNMINEQNVSTPNPTVWRPLWDSFTENKAALLQL